MRRSRIYAITSLWSAFIILIQFVVPIAAAKQPSSNPQIGFAYGARIDTEGGHLNTAIEVATQIGLQWLGLTLDWESVWSDPKIQPDFSRYESVLSSAETYNLSVMISITGAPSWAQTPTGPHPDFTTILIEQFVQRYPQIRAVELFPAANLFLGWGAAPDPQAYLELFQHVQNRLGATNRRIWLVSGGLAPLPPDHHPEDVDDLTFLEGLYNYGGAKSISILSLKFSELTGPPMASPFGHDFRVLRHYELVRQIMLRHGHADGLIWITSFSWPSGKIGHDDIIYGGLEAQADWLHEAFFLLSSQLYIGVAFFDQLNPPLEVHGAENQRESLIGHSGRFHPGINNLNQLISFSNDKEQEFDQKPHVIKKIHFDKNRFKPFP